MATTIEWVVEQMNCYPEKDGEQDVVFTVHWRCNGADGQHSGTAYGSEGIPLHTDGAFTPYADLTQAQVIGWVHSAMGEERVAEIEATISGEINAKKNPSSVTPALPWV